MIRVQNRMKRPAKSPDMQKNPGGGIRSAICFREKAFPLPFSVHIIETVAGENGKGCLPSCRQLGR